MDTQQIQKKYDNLAKNKYVENYEYHRWFKSSPAKTGYIMTLKAIKGHFLNGKKFKGSYFELGPGAGTWTRVMHENSEFDSLKLVDVSENMLEQAKNNLKDFNDIDYTVSNFLDYIPNKKYDVFFSSRVLEYIPDKQEAVKKIFDMLNNNGEGYLITKTPKDFINKLLKRKNSRMHQGQVKACRLKCIFKEVGFREVTEYPVTISVPVFKSNIINRLVHFILYRLPLNKLSGFLSESYAIKFKK